MRGCLNPRHRGSSDEIIVEYVGANMGIQNPLLVIDRRVVSVMNQQRDLDTHVGSHILLDDLIG